MLSFETLIKEFKPVVIEEENFERFHRLLLNALFVLVCLPAFLCMKTTYTFLPPGVSPVNCFYHQSGTLIEELNLVFTDKNELENRY